MKFMLLLLISSISFAQSDFIQLDDTDGYGLRAKPPAFSKAQSTAMFEKNKQLCEVDCVTDFGKKLGSSNGINGYSNCRSECVKNEYSFLNLKTGEVTIHKSNPKNDDLHYIGLINQCVEYSRRWWMVNKGITYGSIDSAHEIIYLTEGKDIRTNETFALARSINGTATRAPKTGDLVIYYPDRSNPLWQHGHVAVIVGVNLKKGTVSLAEENYNNKQWKKPKKYARQISLFEVNGHYTLIDVAPNKSSNKSGAEISGWIYPKE